MVKNPFQSIEGSVHEKEYFNLLHAQYVTNKAAGEQVVKLTIVDPRPDSLAPDTELIKLTIRKDSVEQFQSVFTDSHELSQAADTRREEAKLASPR